MFEKLYCLIHHCSLPTNFVLLAVKHGVTPDDASYFVGRSYLSMVQDAERNCQDNPRRFDDLIEEQTPGGLNEQVNEYMMCVLLYVCVFRANGSLTLNLDWLYICFPWMACPTINDDVVIT